MPLYLRNVGALHVSDLAYHPQANDILRQVSAHKLVGLLNQLNDLSQFAADLFGEVFVDAQASGDRLLQLAQRVRALEAEVPRVRQVFSERDPASWYMAEAPEFEPWSRGPEELAHSLFTAERQPVVLQQMRLTLTDPLPNLATVDHLAVNRCAPLYSDPGLFLREWLREEHSRQAAIQERKQRSRAARKAKRGAGRRSNKKHHRASSDVDEALGYHSGASGRSLEPLDEHQEADDKPSEEQQPSPAWPPRSAAPSQSPSADSSPLRPSPQRTALPARRMQPPNSPLMPPPEDGPDDLPAGLDEEETLPPPDDQEEEMSASLITGDVSPFPTPPVSPRVTARGASLRESPVPSAPASPLQAPSSLLPSRESPPKMERLGSTSSPDRPSLRRTISPSRTREHLVASALPPAASGGLLDQIRSNNLRPQSNSWQAPKLRNAQAPDLAQVRVAAQTQAQTQSTVMYILSRRAAIEGSDQDSSSDYDDEFD